MKYLNKYSSWRKINEEISDNKVVDAANKAEEILQPKRADELRMQIVPEFKDPFKFFFFPLSINGDVVNIPSYTLRPGDVVGVREKSKSLEAIANSLSSNTKKYDWLDWDNSAMAGKLLNLPSREMIPENIKEQLIVELYSK